MTTVSADGRRAAVLGKPIAHSLSPVLHRAAYHALGLSGWRYDSFECDEDGLVDFVSDAGPEWVGLSLTMPLKRQAMVVADERSPLAEAVGAANTMVLSHGSRRAENTDVKGIIDALREAAVTSIESAVILGAGGTAQAALAAVHELGQSRPTVLVRDPSRAVELRAAAARLGVEPRIVGGLVPGLRLPQVDLVISALPAGAADTLRISSHDGPHVVLDVVYARGVTPFAATAARAGADVVSGLTVLLHQAVGQVELMTGLAAPVARMREALMEAAAPAAPKGGS